MTSGGQPGAEEGYAEGERSATGTGLELVAEAAARLTGQPVVIARGASRTVRPAIQKALPPTSHQSMSWNASQVLTDYRDASSDNDADERLKGGARRFHLVVAWADVDSERNNVQSRNLAVWRRCRCINVLISRAKWKSRFKLQ